MAIVSNVVQCFQLTFVITVANIRMLQVRRQAVSQTRSNNIGNLVAVVEAVHSAIPVVYHCQPACPGYWGMSGLSLRRSDKPDEVDRLVSPNSVVLHSALAISRPCKYIMMTPRFYGWFPMERIIQIDTYIFVHWAIFRSLEVFDVTTWMISENGRRLTWALELSSILRKSKGSDRNALKI